MTISQIDAGIVRNLRDLYGDKIAQYSDEAIAKAWRNFSLSDEYPDREHKLFPEWISNG